MLLTNVGDNQVAVSENDVKLVGLGDSVFIVWFAVSRFLSSPSVLFSSRHRIIRLVQPSMCSLEMREVLSSSETPEKPHSEYA